jgi:hypothetical protein
MFTRLLGCATIVFALATALPAAPAGQQTPEQQQAAAARGPAYNARHVPHMSAALGHLEKAQAELEKAAPNKGGHKEKAMDLTKQAMDEVQQGIQYYNEHPPEPPKK